MGNYSGTIRCGHCYERGHNRAGCPKLTAQLQERWDRIVAHESGYDDDSYSHRSLREKLAKRTGVDPITGESTRKRRATYGGRVCSYCQETGHNRRTCPALKKDREQFRSLTAKMRTEALAAMREHGLGPGALLMQDDYGTKIPHLVVGIQWDAMHENARWPRAIKTRRVTDNRDSTLMFPSVLTGSESRWENVEIASPAKNVVPPEGWATATDHLDLDQTGVFDKAARRDYWFWREREENNA